MTLTHFSCFSGIGGLDLAAEWAGFRTIGQVEKDDYANKILGKRWPNVPRWGDIKDVTIHSVREAGIGHAPTVLSGGFPCQPFSCAGQRRGAEDDRYLWPEMLRVVQELRPAWVVGENVAGIISMALDDVCADLERAGYSCRAFLLPAAGVGAPHMRDRVFIVAHSARELSHRSGGARHRRAEPTDGRPADGPDPLRPGCEKLDAPAVAAAPGHGARGTDSQDVLHPHFSLREPERQDRRMGRFAQPVSWGEGGMPSPVLESGVCGVADGISHRVDRLRCLGNAVVPQQAYPIFQAIAAIEIGAVV